MNGETYEVLFKLKRRWENARTAVSKRQRWFVSGSETYERLSNEISEYTNGIALLRRELTKFPRTERNLTKLARVDE